MAETVQDELSRPLLPRFKLVPAAQGPGVTVHILDDRGRTSTGLQYRFERKTWEWRQGYGEPWRGCSRPDLPEETLLKLEAA